MALSVKLSEKLIDEAELLAKASNRSLSEQIEHWAISGFLISSEEIKASLLEPYK